MKITLDAGEASQATRRLNDAASTLSSATPNVSNYAAFGPAALGAAVAQLIGEVTNEVSTLKTTWTGLGEGVTSTLTDFSQLESTQKSTISRYQSFFK